MLILTRRAGDAILIDGGIRIVVLGIDPRGVRLGIEAPASTGIMREEIVAEIAAENRRAIALKPADWLAAAAVATTQCSAGSCTSSSSLDMVSLPE